MFPLAWILARTYRSMVQPDVDGNPVPLLFKIRFSFEEDEVGSRVRVFRWTETWNLFRERLSHNGMRPRFIYDEKALESAIVSALQNRAESLNLVIVLPQGGNRGMTGPFWN